MIPTWGARVACGARGREGAEPSLPDGGSRGAVTAELAMGILVVVALLGVLLTAISAGLAQLKVEEAVRGAAREIARGESHETAIALAHRTVGEGVMFTVEMDGSAAKVTARLPVPGPLAVAGGVVAQATVSVRLEPSP